LCMPGEDIEIRPAKAGDLDQLWPLVEDFAFSYRAERSAFERSFGDFLDRSDTLVLVAVSETLPRSLLKFSGGHSSFRLLPDRTLRV
jgi:hypothetical protein